MNDLISRKALCDFCLNTKDGKIDANDIMRFPSTEIKQKKGTWKPDESGNVSWICSACGFASEAFGANMLYYFCPNCGCEMTRGDHE